MIGTDTGFFIGAKPYDFTDDANRRVVGANVMLAHKSTPDDLRTIGMRYEEYGTSPEAHAVLTDLKPFHEYVFSIEIRKGWKKAKIISISAK